eukprot:g3935.t1
MKPSYALRDRICATLSGVGLYPAGPQPPLVALLFWVGTVGLVFVAVLAVLLLRAIFWEIFPGPLIDVLIVNVIGLTPAQKLVTLRLRQDLEDCAALSPTYFAELDKLLRWHVDDEVGVLLNISLMLQEAEEAHKEDAGMKLDDLQGQLERAKAQGAAHHEEGRIIDPNNDIVIINVNVMVTFLVIFIVAFEFLTEKLDEYLARAHEQFAVVMSKVYKEVMTLGLLAFALGIIKFAVVRHYFVKTNKLPANFDFAAYLWESLACYITESIEIGHKEWICIMLLTWLNWARIQAGATQQRLYTCGCPYPQYFHPCGCAGYAPKNDTTSQGGLYALNGRPCASTSEGEGRRLSESEAKEVKWDATYLFQQSRTPRYRCAFQGHFDDLIIVACVILALNLVTWALLYRSRRVMERAAGLYSHAQTKAVLEQIATPSVASQKGAANLPAGANASLHPAASLPLPPQAPPGMSSSKVAPEVSPRMEQALSIRDDMLRQAFPCGNKPKKFLVDILNTLNALLMSIYFLFFFQHYDATKNVVALVILCINFFVVSTSNTKEHCYVECLLVEFEAVGRVLAQREGALALRSTLRSKLTQRLETTGSSTQDLRKLFGEFDKDNSGTISRKEFKRLLKKLHIYLGPFELRGLIRELDPDLSGQISENEFLEIFEMNQHEEVAGAPAPADHSETKS